MKHITGLLLLISISSFSQDTAVKKWTFQKSIVYWGKWQTYDVNAKVKMPRSIKEFRQNNTQLPATFDTITDNPLRHGATYVALHTQWGYRNRIFLFADVYGEHRGVSYGLYNRNNTVLYPVMRIEASDTLQVFKNSFVLSGKAGQFLNERLDEGLMIYNIDVQGIQLKTALGKMELQATQYGDLYNGIGLNIDDLIAISIRRKFSNEKGHIGVSWVMARPPYSPLKNFFDLNLFGRKEWANTSVYAQASYRPFEIGFAGKQSLWERAAFVAGLKTQKQGKRLRYEGTAELRYYGWQFNFIHAAAGLRYRKPAAGQYEMYANTVGDYLYPLRKFDTPFSQWAVFTEYIGNNIGALSVQGKLAYRFSKKMEGSVDYDFNFIQSSLQENFYLPSGESRRTSFLYPFFESALNYLPAENFKASVFLSNKAMNLDVTYPTHYLLAKPMLGLSVEANF